jgi:hypothetical protein
MIKLLVMCIFVMFVLIKKYYVLFDVFSLFWIKINNCQLTWFVFFDQKLAYGLIDVNA